MWEKLYEIFGVILSVVLIIYGIFLVTFVAIKVEKIKNKILLQKLTFCTMVTTIAFIMINLILELIIEKHMEYGTIFFIVLIIETITLYFFVKNIKK